MSLRQMFSRRTELDRSEQEASNERRWSRLGSNQKARRDWAAYLLASAAIVGALAGLRASQLSSGAADDATLTRRIADGRATHLGMTARWVFSTIGSHKVHQAILEARAESLRVYSRRVDDDVRHSLLARANALRNDRDRITEVLRAYGDPYVNRTSDGTYSFGDHLVEHFGSATQIFPDPFPHKDAVAKQSDRAVATMSVSIVAAIAFLLGAVAEVVVTRFRRPLVLGGFALVLAGVAALIVFDAWGVPWVQ